MLAATLALAAGCGVLSGEPGAGGGGLDGGGNTFNDQLEGDISDLDPATATDPSSLTVLGNVSEGLYRLDENGEPVPGMAESVEISDDLLTYTFTLRDGIRWSNGDPVTAQDFEYAWLRAMAPDTDGEHAHVLTEFIEGGAAYNAGEAAAREVGVEAADEETLEGKLASPSPFFLGLTTLPTYLPLKKGFVEGLGEAFAQDTNSLLYNGSYEMTGLDPARGMKLEKREDYWDTASVDAGTVNGRVAEGSAALERYESGELDVAVLGPGRIPEYEADENFEQHTDLATFSLYLNDEDPVMGNLSLRKAVQAGLDRESFVEAVRGDGSAPAYGYVPYGMSSGSGGPENPGGESFREVAGDTVPEVSAEEARRYWEQGVEELGEEPTLTIMVGHAPTEREAGILLQEQLEESLGAEVEVEVVPPEVLLEREEAGDFQISASRRDADYDDPASHLDPRDPDASLNHIGLDNARYDELVNAARAETDERRRTEMLVRAERILVEEEAGVAPIHYPGASYLINPDIENYVTRSYGVPVIYSHVEVNR